MRAFIFSLDSFVAFTIALIAIYSLIFFSSIPSSYYYLLTQGHFMTRDVLMALSTTECTSVYSFCSVSGSVLDGIVSSTGTARDGLIQGTIGEMIPSEFGYALEMSDNEGQSWYAVYDTRIDEPDGPHTGQGIKLLVSSQVMTFGYGDIFGKKESSKYAYRSCGGSEYDILITCGNDTLRTPEERGEIVPKIDTVLVRFTVFI